MNVRTTQARRRDPVGRTIAAGGRPLDGASVAMGRRAGHDFSRIRIHTDDRAAASATSIGARAYTVGNHIVFARGAYQPESEAGRRTVAHELAHTLQQANPEGVAKEFRIAPAEDAHERAADAIAEQLTEGRAVPPPSRSVEAGVILRQQAAEAPEAGNRPGCTVRRGIPPTNCGAYGASSWWLPFAYVNNATCACSQTPDSPTANCVRAVLQERLASTSLVLKVVAAAQKSNEVINPLAYAAFVQTALTPMIYVDHVVAYASCCCPSGPAPYPAWIGVTTVPLPCSLVGDAIRYFGSCHGTPGSW